MSNKNPLTFSGEDNGRSKLTWEDIDDIRSLYPGNTQAELAEQFGVSQKNISRIVRRETWK